MSIVTRLMSTKCPSRNDESSIIWLRIYLNDMSFTNFISKCFQHIKWLAKRDLTFHLSPQFLNRIHFNIFWILSGYTLHFMNVFHFNIIRSNIFSTIWLSCLYTFSTSPNPSFWDIWGLGLWLELGLDNNVFYQLLRWSKFPSGLLSSFIR